MKSFNRLIAAFVLFAAAVFMSVNALMLSVSDNDDRKYLVEVSRIVHEISDSGTIPDVSGYGTILGVYEQSGVSGFFESGSAYVIREVNARLYRIEYAKSADRTWIVYVDMIMVVFIAGVTALLLYIRRSILKPFAQISEMPYELAKGGLTMPLKESRQRYFGKFVWGLDMLREKLESSRQTELELQKEKKTLLMSLSHDIKTPLAAIKLYSSALSKGIYPDVGKQREAAGCINAKADEIEQLLSEIMRSGTEDIMHFDVNNREFYLSAVIDRIQSYYSDKISGTVFSVGEYQDCLIYGDEDRLSEVLQNIIENAIKYGDGRSIAISFSDEEDCRLVTVSDSGCTLPENELTFIFDSFRRGSNVGSQSGSGLGLYICRQLMSAMNGDIFAETDNGEMRVTAVCRKASLGS